MAEMPVTRPHRGRILGLDSVWYAAAAANVDFVFAIAVIRSGLCLGRLARLAHSHRPAVVARHPDGLASLTHRLVLAAFDFVQRATIARRP